MRRTSHHQWTSPCWSYRLMLDLSVSCVPRPCLYMLGSSSQPKCFACVNLAYTRCMWTLESITPDHHVVLQNNELSQWCTIRGNTSLEIIMRDHLIYYRRSKQIRCKNMINITCNQKVTWYGQYHFAPSDCWGTLHKIKKFLCSPRSIYEFI